MTLVVVACGAWCIWTGVLSYILDQTKRADSIATFIGLLIIVVGAPQ